MKHSPAAVISPFMTRFSAWKCLTLVVLCWVASPAGIFAAENLTLAPGLSFTDDSSDRFPITGDRLDDGIVGPVRPTLVFFGAAHCWNTNREAERVVALYPKFKDRIRFVVVDVNHPSNDQRGLVRAHYHGSIPTVVVLGVDGAVLHDRPGETASHRGDTAALAEFLSDALAR